MSNKPLDKIYLQAEQSADPDEGRCWCIDSGVMTEDLEEDWIEYYSREFVRKAIYKTLKDNNKSREVFLALGQITNILDGNEEC